MIEYKKLYQIYLEKTSIIESHSSGSFHYKTMYVIIPIFNEKSEDIDQVLTSLNLANDISKAQVLLVFNYGLHDPQEIKTATAQQYNQFAKEAAKYKNLHLLLLMVQDLSKKKAGVGMARRLGMDYIIRNIENAGINPLLVCLDTDCVVAPNYIETLSTYSESKHKKTSQAYSIGFAHPVRELEGAQKQAIIDYELHLRYFINMQVWCGLPFAFQTIGSSMAVTAVGYCQQGGMPAKQAGEDFYFLHKYSALGQLQNIPETLVFPSARTSTRVPFGTGKAVMDHLNNQKISTYSLESFRLLKPLITAINDSFHSPINTDELDSRVLEYFTSQGLFTIIDNARANATTEAIYLSRVYRWLNAFRLMKYCHFMRDHYFPNIEPLLAVNEFLRLLNKHYRFTNSLFALYLMRELDRNTKN